MVRFAFLRKDHPGRKAGIWKSEEGGRVTHVRAGKDVGK